MGKSCRSKPCSCCCCCSCCNCCGFIICVLKEARDSLLVAIPTQPGRLALVTDIIKGTLQMLTASVLVSSVDGLSKLCFPTLYNLSAVPQESTHVCHLQTLSLMLLCPEKCIPTAGCTTTISLCPIQETHSLLVGKKNFVEVIIIQTSKGNNC